MSREQLIVTIAALVAILVLYQLPKVVVDNEGEQEISVQSSEETSEVHTLNIPDSVNQYIETLRARINSSNSQEKNSIFADSLARTFLVYSRLDSAAKYADLIASVGSMFHLEAAGDIYYRAFGLAGNSSKAEIYGQRLREIYGSILENSTRPDLEAKLAMTYVSGANPMEGILKLRKLVEEDEDNLEAQYNLGLLSIRSGQYDRAIERFKKVTELNPNNMEGYFYLGISYLETGNTELARENFNYVIENGNNEAIISLVEDYLKRIN